MSVNSQKTTYSYTVDVEANSASGQVVRFTLEGGMQQSVLEIGAGPGSITRALVGQGLADVTALEIDPARIAELKTFTPTVVSGDLNSTAWPAAFNGKKFDVIIAADVLEHLNDPVATLRIMKEQLTPTGCVILSIPHVSHAALMAAMWHEDFAYSKTGLLDDTHIKFFGIKNMQKLVADAGLKIEQHQFVQRPPEKTEFAALWDKTPANVREALLQNPFGDVYQVVVRLRPGTGGIQLLQQSIATLTLPFHKRLAARFRRWNRARRGK